MALATSPITPPSQVSLVMRSHACEALQSSVSGRLVRHGHDTSAAGRSVSLLVSLACTGKRMLVGVTERHKMLVLLDDVTDATKLDDFIDLTKLGTPSRTLHLG